MIPNVPSVYNQPTIYNQAGGVPKIPGDIVLYEKMYNSGDVVAKGRFKLNFNGLDNSKIKFIISARVNLDVSEQCRLVDNPDGGQHTIYLLIRQNSAIETRFEYSNGAIFTTSNIIATSTYSNMRVSYCFDKQTLSKFLTNETAFSNGSYAQRNLYKIRIPGNVNVRAGMLEIYRVFAVDENDDLKANFYPAKKLTTPGMYEIISGTFYPIDEDIGNWTFEGPTIIQ